MSNESYEEYVERRRADKSIVRKQNKHLWFVLLSGLAFYGFTSWVSRGMDQAAEAQEQEHRGSGGNPWALNKPTAKPAAH